ncbi:hypothetical protein NKR19_g9813 [Coniochaeta hoffmannii]|uniref:Dirigent protein n=1 Tax=Coniochaeta hoffmannii TaxID=91930 RepID=A0AA38R0M4_9PEZI|nr:hypothetical protein NKR19_g9813 [Coniochaeta hoffmannii]
MHFSAHFLATSLGGFSSLAAASAFGASTHDITARASTPAVPFELSYLFTAHLGLGAPSKPIAITGGVLIDEPIANGTISGPAINATIKAGIAYPQVLQNGTVQIAQILAYGTADDGVPFTITETGIGNQQAQVTRILKTRIGGGDKYKALQDGYILASVNHTSESEVLVHGYLVTPSSTTSKC